MARIDSSKILKPGAILEVKKIDFTDPKVQSIVAEHHRQVKLTLSLTRYSQKKHDNMHRVITI